MAPAKKKASTTTFACLSTKKKKTTAKSDAELKMNQEAATTRSPTVQLSHAYKERLEEPANNSEFGSVGSTVQFLVPSPNGATAIGKIAEVLGHSGGAQTVDWVLKMLQTKQFLEWLWPTQTGRLEEVTRELGFDRGGQTVDWLLPMASQDFLKLTHSLGFRNSASTVQWLLDQAKPAIAARIGMQNTQAQNYHSASLDNITGYPGTYSLHAAPLFSTQFTQNPQWVTPSTFTPTITPMGGLGGGSSTRYSSNPHTATPTPSRLTPTVPVQSSTGPLTAHRSDLPIPDTYFNEYPGGNGSQFQMKENGQFQIANMSNNSMYNSARTNMQEFRPHRPQSLIRTPMQHPINIHPSRNPAGVRHGFTRNRMDQLQAPLQKNHLISQGSSSLHELEGISNAQNHFQAMQLPVQNGGTVSNQANRMSFWSTPNPNPAQDVIKQVETPVHHITTEGRMEGQNPNQPLQYSDFNGGQPPSIQFPIDLLYTQSDGEKENGGGVQNNSQGLLNDGPLLDEFGEPQSGEEDDNPTQQTVNEFNYENEFFEEDEDPTQQTVSIEMEIQTDEKWEVNEYVNIGIESQTERPQDFISEMEEQTDGGRNEGSAEATNEHGI